MPEQIRCPSCSSVLRVPDTLLGKNVKCPKCTMTFVAEMEEEDPPEGIVREPRRSPSRSRVRDDVEDEELPPEEEEEEEEERPRRRKRRRRRRISAEASASVAGPAIALMVVSGLAIALSILSLLGNLFGVGLAAAAPASRGNQADLAVNAVTGVGGAIFGLLYWTVVLVGAIKMKSLSSYGFAMTSCIMSMLPCQCCCILGLPFGIWGLVMLNKPVVKDAFS
jgi:predicted Zn finger-like uncharacterized protein